MSTLPLTTLRPHPIEDTNLQVYVDGEGQGKLVFFEYRGQTDAQIRRVPGTNIILIGDKTPAELIKLIKTHGRPAFNKIIPGGISGKGFPKLRQYLGITERSDMRPHSQI